MDSNYGISHPPVDSRNNLQAASSEELSPPLPGHIRFETKTSGTYGTWSKSCYSKDGSIYHETEYLGRCINREKSIFINRHRGFFKFTLENGYENVDSPQQQTSLPAQRPENLSFGQTWVFDEIIKNIGLNDILDNIFDNKYDTDTLYTLVDFRTFTSHMAYYNLEPWFWQDYSSILYPNANVTSQQISDFLFKIGNDIIYKKFFGLYLNYINENYLANGDDKSPFLLDTTGLINHINIPITALSNHNGNKNTEIRLINVVDYNSGLPIYFRYVAGNIIDISILKNTINILKGYHINIQNIIIDAGFYSEDNIRELTEFNIPFVIRMKNNLTKYKEIILNESHDLLSGENIIKYNDRILFGKKIAINIYDHIYYAYLFYDETIKNIESTVFVNKHYEDNNFIELYNEKMKYFGKFIILSNADIETKNILNVYYNRQKIEQIFDIAKNMTGLIPLRTHSEETLRGHLLISFIATIIYLQLSNKISDKNLCPAKSLQLLSYLRIDMHQNGNHIINELYKSQRAVIDALGLTYPFLTISGNERKAKNIYQRPSKGKRGRPKGSKNKSESVFTSSTNSDSDITKIKRSSGRPKGSKNKPKTDFTSSTNSDSDSDITKIKRSPGRPKGSKNKPKTD
jgi:transposase